jgi:prepilin-type N-terminal cleavage/methylation domain-containing protein
MKRGFTLIELAVTLFVLALGVAVAAPSLARGVDTVRARAETAGIATFLRAAREKAIAHNRPYEVRVNTEEGVIELRTGETVLASRHLALGVRVITDPPTSRTVTFLPQGLSSGARLRVEGPGRRAYLVTVDALTGRVATRRFDT